MTIPHVLVAALLLVPNLVSAEEEKRPNIVFVMIDDLGAEQIGVHGGETYPTPNIDRLAAHGMLFKT